MGDLYEIYYNNRDLRLLLDLLASSSGIATALAIMTSFDKVVDIINDNFYKKLNIFF